MTKLDISIGILTWKRLDVLQQTLDSYKANGLLELSNDITIFFQEIGEEEIKLANNYGLKYIGAKENIGIHEAYKALVANAKNSYFLFLENDWYCIENRETVRKRLNTGIEILESDKAQVIRYRHRKTPGYPCSIVTNNRQKRVANISKRNLSCIPMINEELCSLFEELTKISISNENYYFLSPKNICWTNNPCLFKTSFISSIINLDHFIPNAEKINSKYNVPYKKIALEETLGNYWAKTQYVTALSPGLFTHLDYIEKQFEHKRYNSTIIRILSFCIIDKTKRRRFRAKYSKV